MVLDYQQLLDEKMDETVDKMTDETVDEMMDETMDEKNEEPPYRHLRARLEAVTGPLQGWLLSSIPDFFQALCIVSGVMAFFLAACQTSKKSTLSITIELVNEYYSKTLVLYAVDRGEKTPTSSSCKRWVESKGE